MMCVFSFLFFSFLHFCLEIFLGIVLRSDKIYYSMLVLATIGVGGIFTGTNPSYTSHELAHHFRTADVRFVLSEPEILGPVLEAAKVVGIPESSVRIFNSLPEQAVPEGRVSWKEFYNHGEECWVEFDDEVKSRTTAAARLFSSGTTGLPKAVTNTHRNLIAQQELVSQIHPRDYEV
jgi:acyl-CoA synthetase (AMP-forming)/AMP-acid ligase II